MTTRNLPLLLACIWFFPGCGGGTAPGSTSDVGSQSVTPTSDTGGDTATAPSPDAGVGVDAPCVGRTCTPIDCGVIDNGCGLEMDCSGCPDGIVCGAHGVPNECEIVCETVSCASAGAQCGTMDDGCGGILDCGDCTDGTFCGVGGLPNTCGGVCIPRECADLGANCGDIDDGCGGTVACGTCASTHDCVFNVCSCDPSSCAAVDTQCGAAADGCGGQLDCGGCDDGLYCVNGTCTSCAPQCDGKTCGPDGCGGVCGTCSASKVCLEGHCRTPFCEGQCGSNAPQWCGGGGCKCYCNANCFEFGDCCDDVCLSCAGTFTDQCCLPDCDGKQCGADGCGGVCGSCAPGTLCEDDLCMACEVQCEGKVCGDDLCGGSCGQCDPYDECVEGQCIVCEPNCLGFKCGGDGCGGSCGECPEEQVCTTEQLCVDCVPECEGMICGADGCGGTCNDCQFDCDSISDGPFTLSKLDGPIASEDLAFDADGNLVGSNDNAIFKSPYDGNPQVWVPNIEFRAGLRFLPTGDLVVNNDEWGQLLRIEPDGTIHVVLSNLAYPNGLAVHLDGWVVVTEHDAKRVLKVQPYEGTSTILNQGTIKNPNGAAFNGDYSLLYLAGFSGVGTLYAFPVSPEGEVGDVFEWKEDIGTGWLDGIGVDLCGNVYIADYYATQVFRFDHNGNNQTVVMQGQEGSNTYLPNMQWGSGIGGWDSKKLYLPDGWEKDVFEVDMGVPGIPKPYPPAPTTP